MKIDELIENDVLRVHTNNSVYTFKKREDGSYDVSGGYFDKNDLSPCNVVILGSETRINALRTKTIELGMYLEVMMKLNGKKIGMSKTKKIEYWRD